MASLGSRVLAHALDLLLFIFFYIGLMFVLGFMSGFGLIDPGTLQLIATVGISLGPFVYFILLEGLFNGQTLGKKAAGIRVRMADGTPITLRAAFTRNLLRPADLFPATYFVGLITMFLNPRGQRLGDMAAHTIVAADRNPEPIFAPTPHIVGYHALEEHVGDLRAMTPDDYVVLKQLTDRFPYLSAQVQSAMIRDVWRPIEGRLRLPELSSVHPLYVMEAVVMRYGRIHGLF